MEINALKRRSDQAYRIGGEEFLVMCCGHAEGKIEAFINGLRSDVEALGIEHSGNQPCACVTVSVGLGTFRGSCDSNRLFNEVNKALYTSKREGRNRLTVAALHEPGQNPS